MKNFEIFKNPKFLGVLLIILSIASVCLIYECINLSDQLDECKKENVCDPNGVVGLISDVTAKSLVDNYNTSIVDSKYNIDIKNPDSKSVWFSYNEMKKYMCALTNEYKETYRDDTDLSGLGIRVYFGRYPTQNELNLNDDLREIYIRNQEYNERRPSGEPKIEYGEKHCLFFVPTHCEDKSIVNKDIDLQIITEKDTLSAIWLLDKNHGNLAPPEKVEGANYLNPAL